MPLGSDPREPLTADGLDSASNPPLLFETHPSPGHHLLFGNQAFPLREGENLVGRQRDADVSLRSHSVSRTHARIFLEGGRAILEDLESKNGTFVASGRLDRATRIADGDWIRFGAVWVMYRAAAEEDEEQAADF